MMMAATAMKLTVPFMGIVAAVTVPAPVVVLLVAVTAVGVWAAMMWVRLIAGRRRLKQKADLLRGRTRTLENILKVSARINATRNLSELADKVTAAVEEVSGFQRVVLYLWSDTTKAFEVRAMAGVSAKEKADLVRAQILASDYDELTREECRYSNCYLLDAMGEGHGGLDIHPDSRRWKPGQRLIAPLASGMGEVVGYLDLDQPASGLTPSPSAIRQLEFLTHQATTAIESAEVYDHLSFPRPRKN